MEELFEILAREFGDGEHYHYAYMSDETPEFGTIDNYNDALVAFVQRVNCSDCNACYWDGHCSRENTVPELKRIRESLKSKKKPEIKKASGAVNLSDKVTCGTCCYATQTKPRICMCPDSIAKHSYVRDDSYCDKGEPLCVI